MKIYIATNAGGLDDEVSPVFGRCPTFTLVDVEDKEIKNTEVIENQYAVATGGAGIQAAQFVVNKGANAVMAGNYGPNAHPILIQSKVDAIQIQGIKVRDAVMKYLNGELKTVPQPTAPEFGGTDYGRGGGRGMGYGRGGGMGRGRGGGMGRGRGVVGTFPQTQGEGIESLEQQANRLEQELSNLREKINKLKKEEE